MNATLSPPGTERRGSGKEEVDVRNSPYGLCGRKGTWKKKKAVESELRRCVKVEMAVLDSLYLISLVASVDVKQR